MNVVVDTNIVFSGILNPNGLISDLLLNSQDSFDFYAPSYIIDELDTHHQKLLKLSGYSEEELFFLKRLVIKKIEVIDLESISEDTWTKAFDLAKDIDEFDTPFIAMSLELDAPLWTGDKKLINGLKTKGVDWILNTHQILQLRGAE